MNKVIVIGGDHHNILGVVRGLGERGICPDTILVTKSRLSFVDASKYIATNRYLPEEEIIDLLLSKYKNEAEKPVVICC